MKSKPCNKKAELGLLVPGSAFRISLLFGRFAFLGKTGGRDAHMFLELTREKVDVCKTTKICHLRDAILSEAQQFARIIDFECYDIFLWRNSVMLHKQTIEIGAFHTREGREFVNGKVFVKKTLMNFIDGWLDLFEM